MKIFSGRKNPDATSLQNAQGCFASNLAMPGVGSLAGGRKVGILQLGLCLAGFVITLVFGIRFVYWSLAHWSEFYGPHADVADPFKPLRDLWRQARWPLLGIGLFALAWLWALVTSWSLLAEAKNKKSRRLP
jgi:hypothetical protein